eukprot:1591973-Amphidinium_carterae.1
MDISSFGEIQGVLHCARLSAMLGPDMCDVCENNPAIVFEPSILRLVRLARMMRVFRRQQPTP